MNSLPALGIIGYRGFGAFCTEAYHDNGVARVVAFAGRDRAAMETTAARYGVPRCYTDWRELIQDPAVQVVHIVTPPALHKEMATAALGAGKHVFVEKPLATSNEDAQAILEAGRAAKRQVGINYVMRYNLLYDAVRQIARAGTLGALTHVGFENYASDEGLDDPHWFWDKTQSGGIFIEHGVHFFDMVGAIVGAPAQSVLGRTWTRADGTGKQDRVQAIVSYANGAEASFHHAFNRPGALEQQTAHFAFQRGHVSLGGWIPTTLRLTALVSDADRDALRALLPVPLTDDPAFSPPPGGTVRGGGSDYPVTRRVHANWTLGDPTPVYKQAVTDAMADFLHSLHDPAHAPRVTGGDGAVSLSVAIAAACSAIEGHEAPGQ